MGRRGTGLVIDEDVSPLIEAEMARQATVTATPIRRTNHHMGGLAARDKMLAIDPDWYRKMGQKGGKAKRTKPSGFQLMTPEQRVEAGRKGGSISRRRPRDAES